MLNPAIGGTRQGSSGPRGRCPRRFDGAGRRRRWHPVRMLNRRKGPAVRGPRAQADRQLYAAAMQAAIRDTDNLSVIEGEADELIVSNGRVTGIRFGEGELTAGAVVITTGTFLRGLIHLGEKNWPAGRVGEAPAMGLSASFERAGDPDRRAGCRPPGGTRACQANSHRALAVFLGPGVKLPAKAVDAFLARPDPAIAIVLLHGPDAGW